MRRLLSPIALCLSLGACVSYNSPGQSPSAFDGAYQGTVTMTAASPGSGIAGTYCAAPGQQPASLTVQNGRVVWPNGGGTFYAPIANDGAFAAQNGGTYFSGKITNRAMVARGNISNCHTIYDLLKAA
jgi:hypothetical protein